MVVSEPVDVLVRVWAERRCHLVGYRIAVRFHLAHRARHTHQVVENQQIGNQMVVFDEFPLLVSHILCDDTVAAEGNPSHEFVKSFALGRGRLDLVPQFEICDVLQQEPCPHHAAEFPKMQSKAGSCDCGCSCGAGCRRVA